MGLDPRWLPRERQGCRRSRPLQQPLRRSGPQKLARPSDCAPKGLRRARAPQHLQPARVGREHWSASNSASSMGMTNWEPQLSGGAGPPLKGVGSPRPRLRASPHRPHPREHGDAAPAIDPPGTVPDRRCSPIRFGRPSPLPASVRHTDRTTHVLSSSRLHVSPKGFSNFVSSTEQIALN